MDVGLIIRANQTSSKFHIPLDISIFESIESRRIKNKIKEKDSRNEIIGNSALLREIIFVIRSKRSNRSNKEYLVLSIRYIPPWISKKCAYGIHSRTTYVRASKKILDGRKSISISTLTLRFFLRLYRIETNRVENSAARSCYRSCDLESEIIRISRNRVSLLHTVTRYSCPNDRKPVYTSENISLKTFHPDLFSIVSQPRLYLIN